MLKVDDRTEVLNHCESRLYDRIKYNETYENGQYSSEILDTILGNYFSNRRENVNKFYFKDMRILFTNIEDRLYKLIVDNKLEEYYIRNYIDTFSNSSRLMVYSDLRSYFRYILGVFYFITPSICIEWLENKVLEKYIVKCLTGNRKKFDNKLLDIVHKSIYK